VSKERGTFHPDGLVCEKVENLAVILGDLLGEHIKELNRG